ncbi:hypothetical protein XENOCAPTIV_022364 [Xenoophorus captivus]|uniref:Uncharacterized protein n=1 Tax=Xenoophorus captivus TaxID=1517983 RepID=A0ABV0SCA0_9TELE
MENLAMTPAVATQEPWRLPVVHEESTENLAKWLVAVMQKPWTGKQEHKAGPPGHPHQRPRELKNKAGATASRMYLLGTDAGAFRQCRAGSETLKRGGAGSGILR